MKVVGKVNAVHEKTKPEPLKVGEVAVYRLLCGVENPDNEQRKTVPVLYPQSITIPSKDRIKDPHSSEYVDIAVVEDFDTDTKKIRPKKLSIRAKDSAGFFTCSGGIIEQEEQYEYFEMCNYNASNPNRDKSIEPLFERVNPEAESKSRIRKRSALREALKYEEHMSDKQVRELAASIGWNETESITILRDKIGQWIEKDAQSFVDAVEDTGKEIKALVKEAITAGVITHDPVGNRIVQKGQKTALISLTGDPENYLDLAAEWIKTHRNGDKVLQTIKKLMNASHSGATPE